MALNNNSEFKLNVYKIVAIFQCKENCVGTNSVSSNSYIIIIPFISGFKWISNTLASFPLIFPFKLWQREEKRQSFLCPITVARASPDGGDIRIFYEFHPIERATLRFRIFNPTRGLHFVRGWSISKYDCSMNYIWSKITISHFLLKCNGYQMRLYFKRKSFEEKSELGRGHKLGITSTLLYQFTFAQNRPKSDISGTLGPIHHITLKAFAMTLGDGNRLFTSFSLHSPPLN